MIFGLKVGHRLRRVGDEAKVRYVIESINLEERTVRLWIDVAEVNNVVETLPLDKVIEEFEFDPNAHPRPDFKGWYVLYRDGVAYAAHKDLYNVMVSHSTDAVRYEDTDPCE